MGNGRSQAWAREEAVDWREAVTETWRSERSRELDKLGGLGRPTIRRGNSMTEKLVYLQASLNKQGQDMEDALHKGVQKKKMDEKPVSFGFMLATERRALDRGQAEGGGSQQLPPLQQPRSSSVVARQRDYARGPSLQRAATHSYSTGAASGSSTEAAAVAAIADVAEWRLRVHAARRRTMLVVQTVVRLRRGLNHPRRMDRVDSFSLYIPMALADDCGRFVEEAERCATLGVAIRSARAEACALEGAAGCGGCGGTAGGAPVCLPPVRGATPNQQPSEAEEGVGQAGGGGGADRGRVPRTMSRRAASDAALMSALADMDGIGVAAAQQLGFGAGLRSLSAVERSEVDRGGAGAADTVRALAKDGTEGVAPHSPPPPHQHQLPPLDEEGFAEVVQLLSARLCGQAASEGGNEAMHSIAARARAAGTPPGGVGLTGTAARRSEGNAAAEGDQHPRLSFPMTSYSGGSRHPLPPLPKLPLGEGAQPMLASSKQQQARGAAISEPGSAPRSGGLLPRLVPPQQSGGSFSGMHLPNIREDRASAPLAVSTGGAASGEQQHQENTRRLSLPGRAKPRGSGAGAAREQLQQQQQRPQPQGAQGGRVLGLTCSAGVAPLPFRHSSSMPLLRHGSLQRSSSSLRVRARGASASESGAALSRRAHGGAAEKLAALDAVVQAESAKLLRSHGLLGMFVNRANASWAQSLSWRAPAAVSEAEQRLFQASDEYTVFKADLVRKLRAGHVAFQVYAAEDELALPNGQLLDVWTADPWDLVAAARPGSMPITGERLQGLPLGGRVLTALRAAVLDAAGPDAASRLTVVLHLNEAQAPAALADLHSRQLYGLPRDRLFITVEQRTRGYTWDAGQRTFADVHGGDAGAGTTSGSSRGCMEGGEQLPYSHGSGYAAMQMAWVSDAFMLGEDGGREPLKTSLLEELGKHGVEWLVSRRAADLSLLTQTSALDIPELAHVVRLRQSCRALRMSAQATATDSLSVMRAMNSVMLACTRAQPGGSIGDPSGVPTVVELRTCEVASTGMVDTLKRCRTEAGGRVLVGLHRYVYHVPSLGKQLAQTSALRPKLLLEGSTVHVSLEASDLTASGGCVALARGPSPRTLLSPAEVEDLIPLLLEQDHDMRFRRAAGASAQSASSLVAHKGGSTNTNAAAPSPAPSASARGGQLIVVLCSDNSVTVTALELVKLIARPGRDEVSLVTVVRSTLQQEDGRQLLMRLGRELARAMIMPRLDVIVRGHTGLLDAIQEYVVSADAGLVVMGSVALTTCATLAGSGSSGASSVAAAVGSVTVAIAKRLPVPLAVVTANTRLQRSPVESSRLARRFAQQQAHVGGVNGTGAGGELGGLGGRSSAGCGAPRVLAVVERHSQAMLSYLCSRCLDPLRGDQLLLGQVFTTRMLTREQAAGTKRVMESFYDVAAKAHLPPVRMQLNGAFDKALAAASDAEGVQLLALQLKPEERGLPGDVLSLMRSSRAAVLLFHDRPRAVISAPSALPS